MGKKYIEDNIEKLNSTKQLSDIYGPDFISLLVEAILQSYPSKKWAIEHEGKVEDHLELSIIYLFSSRFKIGLIFFS